MNPHAPAGGADRAGIQAGEGPASSRLDRCALRAQQTLRVVSHPVPSTKLTAQISGGLARSAAAGPEAGRPLPLRVRDKGSPKVSQRPLPQPLRPPPARTWNPGRLRAVPGANTPLHHCPPLRAGQRGSGSQGHARTSHSRGHPHPAPFPQCNFPPSGGLPGLWRTPKRAPHLHNLPLLLLRPLASPHPSPRGPILQPRPQPGAGLAAWPREGVGQVSRLRAASAPTATASAPSFCVPRNPSLAPFPMFNRRQPIAASSASGERGTQQARLPAETPCDRHCTVTRAVVKERAQGRGGDGAPDKEEWLDSPC